jgi:3-methyladenine DNA glycosylase AlkD
MEGYGYRDTTPQHQKADEAVRHIGTNSVPTLLRMLRAKDSAFKVKLRKLARKVTPDVNYHMAEFDHNRACEGFRALGPVASNAVPQLIEIYDQNISETSQLETVDSLAYVGPAADAAIPALLQAARTNSSVIVRIHSVLTVGAIHTQPEKVVPVLMDLMKDSLEGIRRSSAEALGNYGTNASPAIATLSNALNDPKLSVRDAAEDALKQIDPETAAKAGIK